MSFVASEPGAVFFGGIGWRGWTMRGGRTLLMWRDFRQGAAWRCAFFSADRNARLATRAIDLPKLGRHLGAFEIGVALIRGRAFDRSLHDHLAIANAAKHKLVRLLAALAMARPIALYCTAMASIFA